MSFYVAASSEISILMFDGLILFTAKGSQSNTPHSVGRFHGLACASYPMWSVLECWGGDTFIDVCQGGLERGKAHPHTSSTPFNVNLHFNGNPVIYAAEFNGHQRRTTERKNHHTHTSGETHVANVSTGRRHKNYPLM